MKLNKKGYELIAKHEGLKLSPYLCPAKIPTIGYGNTYYPNGTRVTLLDPPITKEYALEIFEEIADRFAKRVSRLVKKDINQNQFNALVSFAYNVGVAAFQKSTLLRLINADAPRKDIEAQFMRWTRAGGVVMKGLENRRKDEVKEYFL